MHPSVRLLSMALVLVVTGPRAWSQAQAPDVRAHDGFWIAYATGYGWAQASCDQCAGGPQRGGRLTTLRLGGTPSSNVRLGADIGGWGGDHQVLGNLAVATYYYPSRASGVFVMGGLGVSGYVLNTSPQTQGNGWGLTAGVGDELRLGRHFSLAPLATVGYGSVGDVTLGSPGPTVATGWKQTFFGAEIGVLYHVTSKQCQCQ
jgi:hypothetical protein